ncbi:unnamed protein product [Rotaria magnacalcarata]|uniref:Reverse transcriptase RNase H-like domain-containing protein n=1 Tax=Rotaria magnacalcarata TaxID=392030 RepID=A0A816VGT7_9BILA|nr:unnamed protein product [Rotaria magnacalcarata]CAF2122842.1 unnamed protein product [Rotaria magnacalcarata]CAF4165498.1 unnamed protein product [Rotaria magnacalcarata]CAF4237695.1 unnamed protein product [Rotaria magnacalcarata]
MYIIRTDASRVGIGTVLLQPSTSNNSTDSNSSSYRPVAFASRSLKPSEKNYSAIELEGLTIWWSTTQKFRSYIEGQRFILETDHITVIIVMKKRYHNSRIERWVTMLQQYDIIIKHISGKDNTTADALSRYHVDKPDVIEDESPHLITSSTQTDDKLINVVTTRSMTRKRPPSLHPTTLLPSTLSNISSPPPSALPSSTNTSSSSTDTFPSSIKNVQIRFDHNTLNQHQNRDPSIWKIKNTHPLDPKYTIDVHHVLSKFITRKSGQVLSLCYILSSLILNVLLAYHDSRFNGAHFGIKRTFYKVRDRFFLAEHV